MRVFLFISWFIITCFGDECFLRNLDGSCYFCSYNAYHPGSLFKGNSDFFNTNDSDTTIKPCIPKLSSISLKRSIIITSESICEACSSISSIQKTYNDIISALVEESSLSSAYVNNEITMYLHGELPHFILPSMVENRDQINFFRRQKIKLEILPLFCSYIQIPGCLTDNKTAKIVLKTSKFFIYVSSSLRISNIELSAPDLSLWGSASPNEDYKNCLYLKEQCCDEVTKLSAKSALSSKLSIACSLKERTVSELYGQNQFPSFALVNMETINDDPIAEIPGLMIFSCKLNDIQTLEEKGFSGIIRILNEGRKDIELRDLFFRRGFYFKGIIHMDSNIKENTLDDLQANITIANTIVWEYNIYLLNQGNPSKEGLVFLKNKFKMNITNLLVFKMAQNHLNFFLISTKTLPISNNFTRSNLIIQNLTIDQCMGFLLISTEGNGGALENISIKSSEVTQTCFLFVDCILNVSNLVFQNISSKAGFQGFLLITQMSNLLIKGFVIESCLNVESLFKQGYIYIEGFHFSNLSFIRYLIRFEQMSILLMKQGLIKDLNSSAYVFDFIKGTNSICSTIFDSSTLSYIFNPDDTQSFEVRNCTFKNLGYLVYISAPGRLYKTLTFFNSTFTNITFLIFFMYYIDSPLPNFLLIKGCSFVDILIKKTILLLCCSKLEISDTRFERVIMDEDDGECFMTMELSGHYVVKNNFIKNIGFNKREKVYWPLIAYNFYSFVFIWYGDSLSVIDNSGELDEEFILAGGLFGAISAKQYFYVNNFTLKSKSTGFERFVRALYIYQVKNITIINSHFFGLGCIDLNKTVTFAHDNGVISIINYPSFGGDDKNENSALIANLSFEYCICKYGGAISIVNYNKIIMQNLVLTRVNSVSKGGGIVIFSSRSTNITNLSIDTSSSLQGSFVYFGNIMFCHIQNMTLKSGSGQLTGGVHLTKVENIIIEKIKCINSSVEEEGGAIYMEQTSLKILGGYFENCKAIFGGVIYMAPLSSGLYEGVHAINSEVKESGGFIHSEDVNELVIKDTYVSRLTSEKISAAILINSFRKFQIDGLQVSMANTQERGTIYIKSSSDTSQIDIHNLFCDQTVADQGSCLLISLISPIKISFLRVRENRAISIIQLSYSSLTVTDISNALIEESEFEFYIRGLMAEISMKNLTSKACVIMNSFLYLETSIVGLQDVYIKDFSSIYSNRIPSPLFVMNLCLEVKFINLNIIESFYYPAEILNLNGGKLLMQNVIIKSVSFPESIFKVSDSESCFEAIFISEYKCGSVFNLSNSNVSFTNSLFYNPNPVDLGKSLILVDIYAKATVLQLNGCKFFTSNKAIIHRDSERLLCFDTSFFGIVSINSEKNFFYNLRQVDIKHSSFLKSNGKKGSAITFISTEKRSVLINIENSNFTDGAALSGGALYFEGAVAFFCKKCFFENNSAKTSQEYKLFSGVAGALLINCTIFGLCSGNIKDSKFFGNRAESFGATAFSNILVEEKDNLYLNNSDSLNFSSKSGSVTYCASVYQVKDNETEFFECVNESKVLEINSGETLELSVTLIDYQGQVATHDNRSMISIKSLDPSINIYYPQENPQAIKGKKFLSPFIIKLTPGKSGIIYLDLEIFHFENFPAAHKIQNISVLSTDCPVGSIVKFDMSCSPCELGTYSWEDPMILMSTGERIQCKKCPSNFFCPGKDIIYPSNGFWRFTNQSLAAIECRNRDACVGYGLDSGGVPFYQPCLNAHYGVICHECINGFGKFSKGGICESCDKDRPLYVLRLVLMIIAVLFYILINTYIFTKQIRSSTQKTELTASPFIVFKVLFNHTQTMSMLSINFNLNNIQFFKNFIELQSYLAIINEDVVSAECLIQNVYSKDYNYIIKIFGLIVLPIAMGIGAFFIWFLLLFLIIIFRRNLPRSVGGTLKKILVSFTIAAYLLYPTIVQSIFSLSNCMSLNTGDTVKSYLYMSPNIPCWEETHWIYFCALFLPSALIWGILFPLVLFYFLRMSYISDKKSGQESSSTEQSISKSLQGGSIFRFFYEDYKSSCFYWEIVIFSKKFLLNILISSTELIGKDFNFALKILLLTTYTLLVMRVHPFYLKLCNYFEISSSLIVIASLNLMNLSNDKLLNEYSIFFFTIILIINVLWILLLLMFFLRLICLKKHLINARFRSFKMSYSIESPIGKVKKLLTKRAWQN